MWYFRYFDMLIATDNYLFSFNKIYGTEFLLLWFVILIVYNAYYSACCIFVLFDMQNSIHIITKINMFRVQNTQSYSYV